MSEAVIMTGLQTKLLTLDDFSEGDVTVGDWSMLDGSSENAPFAIIYHRGIYDAAPLNYGNAMTAWTVRLTLYVLFDGWVTSLAALVALNQKVVALLLHDPVLGIVPETNENIMVTHIVGTEMEEVYQKYLTPEQLMEATPFYLGQVIEVTAEEQLIA